MVLDNLLEPCDFVLFGTKGDLARRKLLPSLYQLEKAKLVHDDTRVLGVARQDISQKDYVKSVKQNIEEFSGESLCEETWKRFSEKLDYVCVDMKNEDSYHVFKDHVDKSRTMVCYLATPPSIFGDICRGLNSAGIIDSTVRVVLEKPLGHYLESSKVINNQVAEFFDEKQIYRIDHYLGKEIVVSLVDSPELLTYLGVFDRFSHITKHNSKLTIPNPKDLENDISETEDKLAILKSYKVGSLSDEQKITKKIAIFDAENNLKELKEFPYHDYPLNQVRGAHQNVISFMSDQHPVRNLYEARDFVKRTDLVNEVFKGQVDWLERQAAQGIYAPDFVYAHLIEQLNEFISYSFEEHPLYTEFIKKINLLEISDSDYAELDKALKNSIENSVTPGFVLLRDFMVSTKNKANPDHGIWSQPNGDEYYKLMIRSYTTTDYGPEKIHNIGLSEVARISSRMKEILNSLGYDPKKSAGEIMNELNEDPSFLYADTPDRNSLVL